MTSPVEKLHENISADVVRYLGLLGELELKMFDCAASGKSKAITKSALLGSSAELEALRLELMSVGRHNSVIPAGEEFQSFAESSPSDVPSHMQSDVVSL